MPRNRVIVRAWEKQGQEAESVDWLSTLGEGLVGRRSPRCPLAAQLGRFDVPSNRPSDMLATCQSRTCPLRRVGGNTRPHASIIVS